ncbi:hypothetical protein [Caballeronia insecticola]|nr:hypothetical protein [Caballeronia insecticola]
MSTFYAGPWLGYIAVPQRQLFGIPNNQMLVCISTDGKQWTEQAFTHVWHNDSANPASFSLIQIVHARTVPGFEKTKKRRRFAGARALELNDYQGKSADLLRMQSPVGHVRL